MTTGQNASPTCRDIEPLERSPEHAGGEAVPTVGVVLFGGGGDGNARP